jgi:hypothetical protein
MGVVVAVLDADCAVLLTVLLLLVDDVQPAIDNEATMTSTMIANNFFIMQVPLDVQRRNPSALLCAVPLAEQHECNNCKPCYGVVSFKSRNSCSSAALASSRCGSLILTYWLP